MNSKTNFFHMNHFPILNEQFSEYGCLYFGQRYIVDDVEIIGKDREMFLPTLLCKNF